MEPNLNKKQKNVQQLVVAGGCFWGLEFLFSQISGVIETEVGYTGGEIPSPTYEMVCTGKTGHAESVRIFYNPGQVTEKDLLKKFFKFHDPTQRNQQGNDIGSQYRSALFYENEDQKKRFEEMIDWVTKKNWWKKPIVTCLEPLRSFWPAESYHQKYLYKNPHGYTCHFERDFE